MGASSKRWVVAIAAALLALLVPAVTFGANPNFPSADPNPRADTPDDPAFDRCEGDDPDTSPPRCSTYFEEEYRTFGFSPDTATADPTGLLPHSLTGTRYLDCAQLDADGKAANVAAEADPLFAAFAECLQIGGIRADSAWKYSTGRPDVSVAILDTGIRWQEQELVNKVRLNREELPLPEDSGVTCADYDCNGDGVFNIKDYADDTRVADAAGDTEADHMLDPSDLIAVFSDSSDADGNGYKDDIAGWDFFDDDNDPFDASSCCSANGHGTGRAREAVAETNNANAGVGMCPDCQVMPLRVWDTFVVPIDSYAMGIVYAADNGASVAEGAVGGLGNTRFARSAFEYADEKGMALTMVSSDINSANHNYPTNYNEAIYIGGSLPDTAPNETCSGPGGLPGIGDVLTPPEEFEDGCNQLLGFLNEFLGITATTQPITTSFFRNSNLTQYGGKADVVLMGSTGSENTGQASGTAALLASFGREKFGVSDKLSGNEIRQLMTMTAEDVLPLNTGVIGQPDKANEGWDPHFGYGRLNLAAAMKRIEQNRIPPEAQINSPDWFAPINVDRVDAGGLDVQIHAAAPHSEEPGDGVGAWELEYACGQDATDSSFLPVPGADGTGTFDGTRTLPKSVLQDLANNCNGEVTGDAGRPAGGLNDGAWPADPYPNPDPERHAFQIRLTVHEAGDATNIGRYRKTLFAYNNDGNLTGWPKPIGPGESADDFVTGSGGEASPRLYDLDGDNKLDVLQATTSGEIYAFHSDGTPVQSFNSGQPVSTGRYALEQNHPVPGGVPTPHESLRVPAIGDIDGDREAEIVATAGEHVYAWNLDGTEVAGFPVRLDPALSDPCVDGAPHPCFDQGDRAITTDNHIKRGFFGSAALADLDDDGRLDIVAAAMDQHVYAWSGVDGNDGDTDADPLPGFPSKLQSDDADAGTEIVTSPAIAQLDGEGPPEVIVATNEIIPGDPQVPGSIFDIFNALVGSATGSNPVYALHGDGTEVSGWPVMVGVLAGDLLPLVLPGHDSAVLDVDGDGTDEVSVSGGTSITPGGSRLVNGDGSTNTSYSPGVANSPDQGPVINLADYSSVGDILGAGQPSVLKGGLTVNGVANLLAVNQNLPFSHVEQAWDPATGTALPGFPRATDDFQLVSQAAIGRVGGVGPGRQALVGTGMYQLHAYGAAGLEPAGWPKFTGGWMQVTPAIGDSDGDGNLDVTSQTREGWSFLWSTGVPACQDSNNQDTNNEWWTYHHDERSTNNYGGDGRPPGTPEGLTAVRSGDSVTFAWAAPGDDWLCGGAERYRVLGSAAPIDHPADGTLIAEPPTTRQSGEAETIDLTDAQLGGAQELTVLYQDDAGNWGHLASVPVPPPGPGGDDTDGDGIDDADDNCDTVMNADQADGDADGVGNVCDNCPATANPGQIDTDNDGVGDACEVPGDDDADDDGVLDGDDECPFEQGPASNNGCPLSAGPGGTAGNRTMTLRVKPRKPRAGTKRRFRFQLSGDPACISGATINFGGKKKLTNAVGKARIKRRFSKRGRKLAVAVKPGCSATTAKVKIRRRR